ncbi:MAG: amidohydrolase family protein [Bacteroidetes bacterium]|nr:amidohydrolase family protein [Bacteroidota bacterium]
MALKRIIILFWLIGSLSSSYAQRTLLIHSVTIVDGSGRAAFRGSVRIKDSLIVGVGSLSPLATDSLVDGRNLFLSPGFIDTHSHHYGDLARAPQSLATNSQGITTLVTGQDGGSDPIDSIRAAFSAQGFAVNVASYTRHSTLREQVLGAANLGRPASTEEVEQMKRLLAIEMKNGSLGLSSGLEYEDAFYSSTQEVLALALEAAQWGGRYISHIRIEDVTLDSAIGEILQIGRVTKMPVQISHLKIGLKDKWGTANSILQRLDASRREGIDVTADVYPYDFWSATLRVLFPKRDYTNLASAQFAVDHLFDPAQSFLVRYAPQRSYVGQTVSALAVLRRASAPQTLIDLIAEADRFKSANTNYPAGVEAIAAKAMTESDVRDFIGCTHSNICSDGRSGGHPRGFGAFTKILRVYVREEKTLSLEEAVHKMTELGAKHVGIKNRGLIKSGYYADLVLFDPSTVSDRSTLTDPIALSEGINCVWINGRVTYRDKTSTDSRSGVFIGR